MSENLSNEIIKNHNGILSIMRFQSSASGLTTCAKISLSVSIDVSFCADEICFINDMTRTMKNDTFAI